MNERVMKERVMNERWKPSVTVAAVIERQHGGLRQFLMVEEQTRDGLRLNNPAGHLEAGESPQQAVVREALEETARVFSPTGLVGIYLARSRAPSSGRSAGDGERRRGSRGCHLPEAGLHRRRSATPTPRSRSTTASSARSG
jgi:8-oxo-dGTP pyrophosphatase MutT (NUDIX family)